MPSVYKGTTVNDVYIIYPSGFVQYRNYTIERQWRFYNDPESRTKPEEPLFMHPTPRAVQNIRTNTTGVFTRKTVDGSIVHYRYDPGLPSNLPLLPPDWVSKHRLDVADRRTQLASFTAELHKATEGFSSVARDLFRLIEDTRRRRWRDLANAGSSLYLGYVFGIRPLMDDMTSIAEGLSAYLSRDNWEKIRSTVRDTVSGDVTDADGYYHFARKTISVRATTYAKIAAGAGQFEAGQYDQWLWENLPLSFVLDYAVNIGSFLAASHALKGLSLSPTVVTTQTTIEGETTFTGGYPGDLFFNKENAKLMHTYMGRAVFTTIPLPPLPEFNVKDSLARLANTLAMLTSSLTSGPPRKRKRKKR